MIKTVRDSEINSAGGERPLVAIPVTAQEETRRKRRMLLIIAGAVLAVVVLAGYLYKRSVDPLHARESLDAGTRLFKIARYDQAILSFDRAIGLKPDLAEAYLLRGKSYVGDSRPDPALLDFTKVIELRPSDPNGWIERGRLYLDLNNFHAAVADASQAIAVSPNQAAAFSLRGTALRKGGDPKKAIEDFNRALALEPSANNYFERGSTYQLLGEHQLAIADFDHVIEMIPDLASPFFARAQSRRALGDLPGAERDHQQGRILDGN
jgi:tetratricopeptide (TPR) repeat protein